MTLSAAKGFHLNNPVVSSIVPKMKTPTPLVLLSSTFALAIDIALDSEKQCSAQVSRWISSTIAVADIDKALHLGRELPDMPCYDLSHLKGIESAFLANIAENQTVTLFSDAHCEHNIGTVNVDGCFTPTSGMRSLAINTMAYEHGVNKERKVEDYDFAFTNVTSLAIASPDAVDISYTNAIIATVFGAATVGLTIHSSYDTCKTAFTEPTAASVLDCAAIPLTSIFAFISSQFLGDIKETVSNTVIGFFRASDGTVTNQKRGSFDELNGHYMDAVFNNSDSGAHHIGHMIRDMGTHEQTSPLYEIDMGSHKMHFSAHWDDINGEVVHHVHSKEDTDYELAKRDAPYPYDSIRWNKGGLDFRFCPSADKSTSGYYGVSRNSLSNTFYDQITCQQSSGSFGRATSVSAVLYNEQLSSVGAV